MIWVIARREFGAMFLSPLAWVILAVIQTILGYMFLTNLENFFVLQPQLIQLENSPGGDRCCSYPVDAGRGHHYANGDAFVDDAFDS